MKHFIVEAHYLVPFDDIVDTIPAHRSFLQHGYDRGLFLCSGPKEPPTGGFLVARAESRAELDAFFENEPFRLANLARFTITEFTPVKRQTWTEHWFGEAGSLQR